MRKEQSEVAEFVKENAETTQTNDYVMTTVVGLASEVG